MAEYAEAQRDVAQVVEAGEQADLGELADAGDEDEAEMLIEVFENAVDVAQAVAHLRRARRFREVIEDGLIIFVDEDHHALTGAVMEGLDQIGESVGGVPEGLGHAVFLF